MYMDFKFQVVMYDGDYGACKDMTDMHKRSEFGRFRWNHVDVYS